MKKLQFQAITAPLVIPALTWIPGPVAGHSLERLQYQVVTEPVPFEEIVELQWAPPSPVIGFSRERYQYQPVTEPIQFEAPTPYDPAGLEWLESRPIVATLEKRRVIDSVSPVFEALYKPEGLQWTPQGKHEPTPVERRYLGDSKPPIFEALYKPEGLQWIPQGKHDPTPVERRYLGDTQPPVIFEALYKPETLEWKGQDLIPHPIPFKAVESSQIHTVPVAEPYDPSDLGWLPAGWERPTPVEARYLGDIQPTIVFEALYDPSDLGWLPAGKHDPTPVEARFLGDFKQAQFFEALYKPEGLQWQPVDSYFGQPLPYSLPDLTVYPIQEYAVSPYDPAGLEWTPRDVLYVRQLEIAPFYDATVSPPIFIKIDWMYAVYVGRSLPPNASPDDRWEPFAAALYDPSELGWLPAGKHDPTPVEIRFLGDFSSPQFEALYKPENLQWLPAGKHEPTPPLPSGIPDFTVMNIEPIPDPELPTELPQIALRIQSGITMRLV